MKGLKVVVLVHIDLIPPDKVSQKELEWADWKTEYYVIKTLRDLGHEVKVVGIYDNLERMQSEINEFAPDIVFNLLEEFQGYSTYDQNIVSLLELMGMPYTGCNPHGLSLGRDKANTKKILDYHGLKTPGFFVVQLGEKFKIPDHLKYPMIVKSLSEEASLGISQDSIVKTPEKLKERVKFIHQSLKTAALVEEYVDGKELYVSVFGNEKVTVLPACQLYFGNLKNDNTPIATRRVKFNKKYCQKYGIRRGRAKGLNPEMEKQIGEQCKRAFRALRMNGYVRMDLRLTTEGEIYFLEVNPNPELAFGEEFANAARYAGMSYDQLIGEILNLGLHWKEAA